MFIEITRNRLAIEASPKEWAELRRGLTVNGDDNGPKRELDFAIMAILQQEKNYDA